MTASSDWMNWNGGNCPIDPDTIVDVLLMDGSVDCDLAGCWDWEGLDEDERVTAYRVSEANTGPAIAPVGGEPGWFELRPSVRTYEQFVSEIGHRRALSIIDDFRSIIKESGIDETDEDIMFFILVRLIRQGTFEAKFLLRENDWESRVGYVAHVCPSCSGEVLH